MSLESLQPLQKLLPNAFSEDLLTRLSSPKAGLSGLTNLGDTSHANASLQILLNNSYLRAFMLGNWNTAKNDPNSLNPKVYELFRNYWSGKYNLISPEDVVKTMKKLDDGKALILEQNTFTFFNKVLSILSNEIATIENEEIYELKSLYAKLNFYKKSFENFNKMNLEKSKEAIEAFSKAMKGNKSNIELNSSQLKKRFKLLKLALSREIIETEKSIEKLSETDLLKPNPETKPKENKIPKNKTKKASKKDQKKNKKTSKKLKEMFEKMFEFSNSFEKSDSLLKDVFSGIYQEQTTCLDCGKVEKIVSTSNSLTLNLPENKEDNGLIRSISKTIGLSSESPKRSLSELLVEHFHQEDNELWFCRFCKKKTTASKKKVPLALPETLVFYVNRLKKGNRKNRQVFSYPLGTLEMNAFLDKEEIEKSGMKMRPGAYRLSAVVEHEGASARGRSTVYCAHPVTGIWRKFNDRFVEEISGEKMISLEVHLLVYERIRDEDKIKENVSIVTKMLKSDPIISKNEGETEEIVLLSTQWLLKVSLLVAPGPPSSNELLCAHGKILLPPDQAESVALKISEATWNRLSSEFEEIENFGNFFVLGKKVFERDVLKLKDGKEECEKCDRIALKRRKKVERETVSEMERGFKLKEETVTYIMSELWLSVWRDFVNEITLKAPGPIKNELLLDIAGNRLIDLVIEKDFRVVSHEVWEYLYAIYGGGPKIFNDSVDEKVLV